MELEKSGIRFGRSAAYKVIDEWKKNLLVEIVYTDLPKYVKTEDEERDWYAGFKMGIRDRFFVPDCIVVRTGCSPYFFVNKHGVFCMRDKESFSHLSPEWQNKIHLMDALEIVKDCRLGR